MNSKIIPHIALISVAFLYGATYVIAKVVLGSGLITPNGFILARLIGATGLLWLIHPFITKERLEREDYLYTALCAVFGIVINQLCFLHGLKHTSAMHASLIMIITPIIVLIASLIILKTRIKLRQIIGMVLGLLGALILILSAKSGTGHASIKGDIFILINACSYAIYLVISKRLMRKYSALTVVKWLFLFGGIMVIPFGMSDLIHANFAGFEFKHWLSGIYVIIGSTFLTYLLNAFALGKVNPSTVGFYIYFQPLIASFIAISIGQDSLDMSKIQSSILLFIGVYLVLTTKNENEKASKNKVLA